MSKNDDLVRPELCKVPEGQTPLFRKGLTHPLLDALKAGEQSRDSGQPSPYHGHSLEHILHAVGWVARDLRLALDAAKAKLPADAIERGAAQGVTDDGYASDLIERLLDAQQDINLAANERMSQPLCDASALIDEVETFIRRLFTPPAPAPDAGEEWKLVPVEPTEEMLSAAEASDCAPYALQAWMSMIAAAPSPTPQPPAVEAEVTPGERLIEAAKEAVAVAKGDEPAASLTVNGHTYVPAAALKAKTDEIERLQRERDEWKNSAFLSDCEAHSGQLEEMTIRAEAAEASNKALREGLEPFAKAADECIDDDDVGANHIWEHPAAMAISIGELRRARALLSEKGGE